MRIPQLSKRQVRIGGSVIVAVLMVAGAYVLPGFAFPHTKVADAALTDQLLANYVSKDSDGDGLPDWQEALYGTDPNNANSNKFGVSDGEAVRRGLLTPTALKSQLPQNQQITADDFNVPLAATGSITDQFSKAFLQAYIEASHGQPLTADQRDALLQKLLTDFNSRASAAFESSYTIVSLHTDTSVTLSAYDAALEKILVDNTVTGEDADALGWMQELMQNSNPVGATKLKRISSTHRAIADALLSMRVPPSLAQNHLELIHAFDTLSKTTAELSAFQQDPLGAVGALAAYTPASAALDTAFKNLATTILSNGEPTESQPGYLIVYIARAQTP